MSRRRFLAGFSAAFAAAPFGMFADAEWLEPTWLEVRRRRIGDGQPTHRLVRTTVSILMPAKPASCPMLPNPARSVKTKAEAPPADGEPAVASVRSY